MRISLMLNTDSDNSHTDGKWLVVEHAGHSGMVFLTVANPDREISVNLKELRQALLALDAEGIR